MGEWTVEMEFYRLRKAPGDEEKAESLEYLERAWALEIVSAHERYLDQALELWPENLDALMLRLERIPLPARLLYLEALAQEHKATYLKGPKLSYANLAQRPYLRLLHEIGSLYTEMGRYPLAAEIYDILLRAGMTERFEFKREILILYYHTGDWEGMAQVYPKIEADEIHEIILLPCLLLAYRTDHLLWVDYFWQELNRLNSDLAEFFSQDNWPIEDIVNLEMTPHNLVDYLTKHDYQTLVLAANPILPSLLSDDYSYKFFKEKAKAKPAQSLTLADLEEDHNLAEALNLYHLYNAGSDNSESFRDRAYSAFLFERGEAHDQEAGPEVAAWWLEQVIGEKGAALLTEAGYASFEALAQANANDLLAIKGIEHEMIVRLRQWGLAI
ncbi:helix-hairpin-helix domain-containing protein [Aerococcus sp. UMB7834]|uniref:helix-hairpin-helix domain-containing protein n=1 Tax=Aerococcus sp. UMB7834 TaxID=3046342 RepID=UPI00254CBEE8|nr:helix-hairpin-helix domain-containing protein [Aerococcus sp. UMB7834]MDK6804524.1 helix-hairpin-helix domain-containing protein [Aerococcus sp. UMB7834]